jgi:hypothetical protein
VFARSGLTSFGTTLHLEQQIESLPASMRTCPSDRARVCGHVYATGSKRQVNVTPLVLAEAVLRVAARRTSRRRC